MLRTSRSGLKYPLFARTGWLFPGQYHYQLTTTTFTSTHTCLPRLLSRGSRKEESANCWATAPASRSISKEPSRAPFRYQVIYPFRGHTGSCPALFLRDTPPADICSFWGNQLSLLELLVGDCANDQKRWNKCIHPEIAPAAGKFDTVAISQMFRHFGLRGQRWLWQFANGFPIAGTLSQVNLFPPFKEGVTRIHQSELYDTAQARFKERARHCGTKDAQVLRGEAIDQGGKDWLSEPIPIAADGEASTWRSNSFNVAFRFGVAQAEKIRACDDLKHSLANLSRAVLTPIKLVSWGHLAQLSHLMSRPRNADWGLFEADHEAAYKQLPIDPVDQRGAIIALRHPPSMKWYGFITRTLIFGAVAAVLHYNVFSRAWTALINRDLGIPLVCFFDDFAATIQLRLGEKALAVFLASVSCWVSASNP